MSMVLTKLLIDKLKDLGVTTLLSPGATLPADVEFEPPCSIKWMGVSHSLRLGAFSYAVSGFYFACRIGRYCSFGEQVQIGRHGHPMHWVSTSPFFYLKFKDVLDQELSFMADVDLKKGYITSTPSVTLKYTSIANDVWIGHGAFILPGITIGDGAVIAAMSVVTKDVPPYAIVAGSPAKVIRFRFSDEQVKALLDSKWWEFAPWQLQGASIDNISEFLSFVADLRSASTPCYLPKIVKLSDVV